MNEKKITDIRLGQYILHENSVGDTWDPAWAEDDNLYFPGNDGSGWDKACSSNLFFNRASGEDYTRLICETNNGMPEYGGWAVEGPDGCTTKSSGCISIDGTLYLAFARHNYGRKSGDPHKRQTAQNGCIIKSADHGLTWTRTARENFDNPMFHGGRFSTPYFIHYGKDGTAPAIDNADRYIYAVSNNGFWCNGDNYILGRVERAKIGRLDAADWQYYTGGDGMLDSSWTGDMHQAQLIIDNPLKCGETGATYIPSLGRYILVAWYYPGDPNVDTDETRFIFYEAPHPWGPWSRVREEVSNPEGWYCPRVLAKWQKHAGNEVEAVLVTGGDYYEMEKYYRFTLVPMKLKTDGKFPEPPPAPPSYVVSHSDMGEGLAYMQYTGIWEVCADRVKALNGAEHFADTADACFTLDFEGSRIKWYTSKENNAGIAAVSVDDGPETLVDLYTYCTVPQYSRFVYDSGILTPGRHTFRVRVTGTKNEYSKGCRVYHDRVEIME